jgi:hypothetical protein
MTPGHAPLPPTMSAPLAPGRWWHVLCELLRVASRHPAVTWLDEQQLRDAGLFASSDAELRKLGLAARRPTAIDTHFRLRRSVF